MQVHVFEAFYHKVKHFMQFPVFWDDIFLQFILLRYFNVLQLSSCNIKSKRCLLNREIVCISLNYIYKKTLDKKSSLFIIKKSLSSKAKI